MASSLPMACRAQSGAFLTAARRSLKGKTLADRSMDLVREGKTSLAEAVRVSVNAE